MINAKRPEITLQTADQFVTRMFETNPDFVFTVTRDRAQLPKPGAHPAGRRPPAPLRARHGVRDARAEIRSEHLPLERAQRTDSAGSAPNPFLPQGASVCLDGGVHTTGPGWVPVLHFRTGRHLSTFSEDSRRFTKPSIYESNETIRRKLIHRESFRASVLRPTLATMRCGKPLHGSFAP